MKKMTDRSKFPMIFYSEDQLNTYFLERLRHLCLEYDRKAGYYPTHELEGFALYYFALHPEYDPSDEYNKIDVENSDGGNEYKEELDKLRGVEPETEPAKLSNYDLLDYFEIEADENQKIIRLEITERVPRWFERMDDIDRYIFNGWRDTFRKANEMLAELQFSSVNKND
jgi:hypothetical protein